MWQHVDSSVQTVLQYILLCSLAYAAQAIEYCLLARPRGAESLCSLLALPCVLHAQNDSAQSGLCILFN